MTVQIGSNKSINETGGFTDLAGSGGSGEIDGNHDGDEGSIRWINVMENLFEALLVEAGTEMDSREKLSIFPDVTFR